MAGKSKVPLFQAPQRFVTIEPGATVGATFGVDLRWPNGSLVKEADFGVAPSAPGSPVSKTLWSLIYEIPPNVTALEVAAGTGLFVVTGSKTGVFRAIDVVDGELTIENADAVDDNPILGLADVADVGGGTLQKTAFDAKGRKTGTSAATTTDLPEGTNLYFTNARADARITLQKGQPLGLATLDSGGKLDTGQLPALAITETFVVASQAAMLALTAQEGDVAVRTDLSKSFILTAAPASTLSNWQELLTPTSAVTSVFGRTGSVTAASGDYTAAQVGADAAGDAAAAQAFAIQRGNHAGTQIASTISDFAATVRSTVLTGLSTASSAAITASDSVLSAMGKLAARLALKFDKTGGELTGNIQINAVANSAIDFQNAGVTRGKIRDNGGGLILSHDTAVILRPLGDAITTNQLVVNGTTATIGGVTIRLGDDSGWTNATLQNSWTGGLGSYANPGYRRIGTQVFLRGVATGGTVTDGTTVFTLPAGYRPPNNIIMGIGNPSSPINDTRVLIEAGGAVKVYGPVSNTYVPFDNILFFTD